jgi:hypothetical protein
VLDEAAQRFFRSAALGRKWHHEECFHGQHPLFNRS